MKTLRSMLFIILLCPGCKNEHKNSNTTTASEPFDLSSSVNTELDAIQSVSQLFVNDPNNQEDHDKNDSITRKISVHTESIINILIESYGKTPTDTIFTVLGKLDNSGYIPNPLYEKLNEEDFSTEIGKSANKAYRSYIKAKEDKTNLLKDINILDKNLSLSRIIENDTILLRDVLLKHKGYKVLDFWATWCAPCRSFNRRFQNHYMKYRDKGIEFYGIGIGIDSKNERDKFLTAVKNDKTPWKQYIDVDNGIYTLFETNTVPYQVLLNERNQIIKILSHDIHKELDEVLKTAHTHTVNE